MIKKRVLTIVLVFSYILAFKVYAKNPGQETFELISSRIRADVYQHTHLADVKNKAASALKMYKDGYFSDIDYDDRRITRWTPIQHLERLYNFALAYTTPGNAYYNDKNMYDAIEKGIAFWYDRNPECDNWWYNQIAEPKCIGLLLLQMQAGEVQLPADLVRHTLDRMKTDGGDPRTRTGANKINMALHWLYRACLTNDAELMREAVEQGFEPLYYTTKEGLQHDHSFFQHGSQLYIVGYGDELIKDVVSFAVYVNNTPFQIDREKLEILDTFVRKTYLKVIRGAYSHFNVMGRSMSRMDASHKQAAVGYCKGMAVLMPEHALEYHNATSRLLGLHTSDYGVESFSKVYFRGDYALHIRPGYSFGVRTVSARTIRNEFGNGENLSTYFVSDGSTHIAVRGDEYYNIFPAWNWTHIPGVTSPVVESVPRAEKEWETPGTSLFTGGASNGLYSVYTYMYEDHDAEINTSAKKSWFFFDDEIVCLGADIHSTSAYPIHTTVNQCLLQGDIIVSKGEKATKLPDKKQLVEHNLKWVAQGGIGYLFPEGGNISVGTQTQAGSWRQINEAQKDITESKEVFTVCVDHGLRPAQGTYAYIVVPGKYTASDMEKYDASNVTIWANNDTVQAVGHHKLDMCQLVFFKPASFTFQGITITVDEPCAIILEKINSAPVLHIADPGHKEGVIHIEISNALKYTKSIVCDFRNTNVYAGDTQSYALVSL